MKNTYVIAEIGKACNGDMQYCKKLIDECKESGAAAVRIHSFDIQENLHPTILDELGETERAWSFKLKLPFMNERLFNRDQLREIIHHCERIDIDFIGTPWDIKTFEIFKALGVKTYKVNSVNATNVPLIEEILKFSDQLFISTGGISESQLRGFVEQLKLNNPKVTLMHAVSTYPSPKTIVNLRALNILKEMNSRFGYSSNDILKTTSLGAVALGAEAIEKHVHLYDGEAELHNASICVAELKQQISDIREMEEVLGFKRKEESRGEMINQDVFGKGLVLRHDVKSGAVIGSDDLELRSPPKGIHSKNWYQVIGKTVEKDLKAGDYLFSDDFKDQEEPAEKSGKRDVLFSDIPGKVRTSP